MLPESFIEAAVVLGMFVVRIGVPIALTLALGYWLEKKLHPREEQQDQAPQIKLVSRPAKSGKIIQLHCWDVRRCETTQRAQCAAFAHPELPCWLALQVSGDKVHEHCFSCALYQPKDKAA